MWVLPAKSGVRPRYEARNSPSDERTNTLRLVLSSREKDEVVLFDLA